MSYYSSNSSYAHRSPSYAGSYTSAHRHGSLSRPPHGYQSTPPVEDAQLWQWFSAVDTDRSGALSVTELQNALVNGNWTNFDLDTVKMLMNIFDTDRSGTIGFTEFVGLWKYIAEWQRVFKHFDRDQSGSIEGRELAEALRSFGYNLSPPLLTVLEQKFASGTVAAYGPPPGITFDRFVRACVTVKTLTEAFQRVDTDNDGWAQLSYEEFMKITLMAP
ncbi:EF-hand [Phlebopus sp. FC_14]|nr:EF-hand [Phlebopus sp. FC_14]